MCQCCCAASSGSSDIDVLSMSGLSKLETPESEQEPGQVGIEAYFSQVCKAPMSAWLLASEGADHAGTEYQHHVMQYFRDVSSDVKHWLSEYQVKQEVIHILLLKGWSPKHTFSEVVKSVTEFHW